MIVVVPFDDDDEAVAIANDTDYGLYDYVFSADTARGLRDRAAAAVPATSASTPRSATTRRRSAASR